MLLMARGMAKAGSWEAAHHEACRSRMIFSYNSPYKNNGSVKLKIHSLVILPLLHPKSIPVLAISHGQGL